MEHAKKMILVNQETFQKLSNQATLETTAPNIISLLDQDMRNILDSRESDHDKWKKYNLTLQRYLHFADNNRKPIKIPITSSNETVDEITPEVEETIVSTLPQSLRNKGTILLDIIKQHNISWDAKGIVSIGSEQIKNSNIIDLVNDILRDRKGTNPIGWQRFTEYLQQINIPLELIANKRRKDYISTLNDTHKAIPNINDSHLDISLPNYEADDEKRLTWEDYTPRKSKRKSKNRSTVSWESFKL